EVAVGGQRREPRGAGDGMVGARPGRCLAAEEDELVEVPAHLGAEVEEGERLGVREQRVAVAAVGRVDVEAEPHGQCAACAGREGRRPPMRRRTASGATRNSSAAYVTPP